MNISSLRNAYFAHLGYHRNNIIKGASGKNEDAEKKSARSYESGMAAAAEIKSMSHFRQSKEYVYWADSVHFSNDARSLVSI